MTSDQPPKEPPSPCVSICIVHPDTGYCVGCYRTEAEIAEWFSASVPRKFEILNALADREATDLLDRQKKKGAN